MATRDLTTNSQWGFEQADKVLKFTTDGLIDSYKLALADIRETLTRLYETFRESGELTKAQATRFYMASNMEQQIVDLMRPYLSANEVFINDMTMVSFDVGYLTHGWAVDQASGVSLTWGLIDDNAVRAASALGGDLGALTGLLSQTEIDNHAKLVTKAFRRYDIDSIKWISDEIKQGVIKGDSVATITKRLRDSGLAKS